jgi:hypothetical protein
MKFRSERSAFLAHIETCDGPFGDSQRLMQEFPDDAWIIKGAL